MSRQRTFGKNEVRLLGYAKIGPSVADYDTNGTDCGVSELAFAVAGQRTAVAAGVREAQPPPVLAHEGEAIGEEWEIDAVATED